MIDVYFPHKSVGTLRVDMHKGTKHFEPWWALVTCDEGIIAYYNWFLKKRGEEVMFNKLWGPHISAIKGYEPQNRELWDSFDGRPIEFWYSNVVRTDNDKHAWLDVFCPDLAEIRRQLGCLDKIFFHLTIGRFKWT
jgi:hypothetical protein